MFTRAGSRPGEAAQLSNIGNVHFERGQLDYGLKSFRDALHVFRLIGHRQGEAQSLANIGLVQRRRGEVAAALKSLREARDIYSENGVQGEGPRVVEAAIWGIEGH